MLESFGLIILIRNNMSVSRMINSKFWSDSFVVDKLNPLDRYLFLYFLTNERTTLSGVYEIPLRTIANETGLDKEEILRMIDRLKTKIEYKDGWVCIINYVKNQNLDNKSIVIGIKNRLNELPDEILEWVKKVRDVDGRGTRRVPEGYVYRQPNLTKLNLTNTTETLGTKISGSNLEENNINKKDMAWSSKQSDDVEAVIQIEEEKPVEKKIKSWDKQDKLEWASNLRSKGSYGELLMEYFIIKEMIFPTKESANLTLRRFVATAKTIAMAYPDNKLVTKGLNHCKKNMKPEMWTLETLIKILPTLR